ncbi:MAG: ABC transporter ATP-binding protein [bacterium]|nr:ABC transporter ATP-binding protein [bacterium]
MIEARALTKRFGGRTAIENVSLAVARGEVCGFLGPNGAGKTTTLRILAGVFPPTSGQAVVAGCDLAHDPLGARRQLGYAPERPALHADMTVEAQLAFVGGLRAGGDVRAAVARVLDDTGLGEVRARRIGTLSRGYRQRVGLATALVGDPPALLLDEPTAGLDPAQAADARALIRRLGADHAVFVSSHLLADVEALCDRVVILHRGHVLATDTPAHLAARLRSTTIVEVEAGAPREALAAALGAIAGVRTVTPLAPGPGPARCRVELEPGGDPRPAIAEAIAGAGWPLYGLVPIEPSLEEAFLALTA